MKGLASIWHERIFITSNKDYNIVHFSSSISLLCVCFFFALPGSVYFLFLLSDLVQTKRLWIFYPSELTPRSSNSDNSRVGLITVEPRCKEPLYNEILDITNGFLYPSNSKIYKKESWYQTKTRCSKQISFALRYIEVSLYLTDQYHDRPPRSFESNVSPPTHNTTCNKGLKKADWILGPRKDQTSQDLYRKIALAYNSFSFLSFSFFNAFQMKNEKRGFQARKK